MADDIVTRLRNSCAHVCDRCERENAYGVGDEAADEIERLRHALDRQNVALDDITHLTTDRSVLHRIKEARRV
jgi:hypothetical protein